MGLPAADILTVRLSELDSAVGTSLRVRQGGRRVQNDERGVAHGFIANPTVSNTPQIPSPPVDIPAEGADRKLGHGIRGVGTRCANRFGPWMAAMRILRNGRTRKAEIDMLKSMAVGQLSRTRFLSRSR